MQLMKRSFNKLVLMAVAAAITAAGAFSIMAQDDAEKTALYTKFTECYKAKDEAGMTACVATGEAYMQKYGAPPDQYNEFVSKQLVNIKARIALIPLQKAYKQLADGLAAKNWKMASDGGKAVLAIQPDNVDVMIILATIAYDRSFATPPDLAFRADGINYAKTAAQKIESGTVKSETWGGTGSLSYKNKENAQAWMNFTAARLIADTNKDATQNKTLLTDAAPYFYKSLQTTSDVPKDVALAGIGRYYLEELNAQVDAYERTCKNLTEDTDDCKRIRGTQLAYAERGADAYSRAYKSVADDPKLKPFKDNLLKKATEFYNIRFKKTDGVNDFVAKAMTQPLVNPTTPITPVAEEPAPVTTTSTTPGTGTAPNGTKPATLPAPNSTKPPTTPAKPATTTPTKPAGSKGTVAKKTTVKKKAGR